MESLLFMRYQKIYEDNEIDRVSLSNDIKLLLKNGVIILDYYGKDKK